MTDGDGYWELRIAASRLVDFIEEKKRYILAEFESGGTALIAKANALHGALLATALEADSQASPLPADERERIVTLREPNYSSLTSKLREKVDEGGFDGWSEDKLHIAAAEAIERLLINVRTEQEMHNAWRKRAEESEAQIALLAKEKA